MSDTIPWSELRHLVDTCQTVGVHPRNRPDVMLAIRHLEHALIGAGLTPDQIWHPHWTEACEVASGRPLGRRLQAATTRQQEMTTDA